MRRLLLARMSEERGIAMITALIISMVIVSLGVTSVSIAVHNSEASAYDRRRVTNIAAAEAGINYYFSHLQSATSASGMQCSITRNMNTQPVTSFTANVTFFNAAGAEMPCPTSTDPATALIESVGQTNLNTTPRRTMQAYVRLTPRPGNPFGNSVVFSNGSINWSANVMIQGADAANSNVYSNGNITLSSSSIIYGSLYAQGTITLNGNAQVRRDAWANGRIQTNSSSSVLGNAVSSTSSITVAANSKIHTDATAGTTISARRGAIAGRITPNSPQGPPPARPFPSYTFNPADWTAQGYNVQTFTGSSACTNAKSFMRAIASTGISYAVRIASDCILDWRRDTPLIRGNLAIISDGGMSVGNQTTWTANGGPWDLHFFFGIDNDGAPCDITWGPGSGIGTNLYPLLYTPCRVSLDSNVYLNEGQIIGGTVNIHANSGIRYRQMGVPGYSNEAYDEDILYVREIITGS